jgi:hypothetical protein
MVVTSEDPAPPAAPKVFLSYAHDSEQHKAQVLRFAGLLREQGVDANLDRYDNGSRQDWYSWMIRQITASDYVLVIASPRYRLVGDGHAPADHNRGVQSEAALLRDLLHADRPTWTRKLLPILLPGATTDHIPLFLQPYCADHYRITEFSPTGIKELTETLSGRSANERSELGTSNPTRHDDHLDGDEQRGQMTLRARASDSSRIYQAGGNQYITER